MNMAPIQSKINRRTFLKPTGIKTIKRVSMLTILMLLIVSVWGNALAQTDEELKDKAGNNTPIMGEIESDIKQMPAVTPEDIWKYINVDQPYRNWNKYPSERILNEAVWKGDYYNTWMEGQVGRIYINRIALSAIDKSPRDLPYGSIIVAELFQIKDDTLGECTLISGFYKVKNSNERYNDWIVFAYTPDGKVMDYGSGANFGTETSCHSCHEAAENDFVWIDSSKYDAEHTQIQMPPRE